MFTRWIINDDESRGLGCRKRSKLPFQQLLNRLNNRGGKRERASPLQNQPRFTHPTWTGKNDDSCAVVVQPFPHAIQFFSPSDEWNRYFITLDALLCLPGGVPGLCHWP